MQVEGWSARFLSERLDRNRVVRGLVAGTVAILTVILLPLPGTDDMNLWVAWAGNVVVHGPVRAYAINFMGQGFDYPPLCFVLLSLTVRVAVLVGIQLFTAIKLMILLFLFLTSGVFWLWTRSFRLTLVLHLSLVLNSVVLGYLDICVAPGVLLTLWALEKRRFACAATAFSLACMTKWQPLILAPFLLLHVVKIGMSRRSWADAARMGLGLFVPGLLILGPLLLAFGPGEVLHALANALDRSFLSANALNLCWVMTHFLHVLHPDRYGGLVSGAAELIQTSSGLIALGPRVLFGLCYVTLLIKAWRRVVDFKELIRMAMLGAWCYFALSFGVHENHLFLAALLSVVLLWLDGAALLVSLAVVLLSNLNLYLFYGVNGSGPGLCRVLWGIDLALIVALINVVGFLTVWLVNVLRRDRKVGGG